MGQPNILLPLKALVSVFAIQEFSEAKRRFDGAPQVIYQHRDPPKELAGTDAASGDNIAYITFGTFTLSSSSKVANA